MGYDWIIVYIFIFADTQIWRIWIIHIAPNFSLYNESLSLSLEWEPFIPCGLHNLFHGWIFSFSLNPSFSPLLYSLSFPLFLSSPCGLCCSPVTESSIIWNAWNGNTLFPLNCGTNFAIMAANNYYLAANFCNDTVWTNANSHVNTISEKREIEPHVLKLRPQTFAASRGVMRTRISAATFIMQSQVQDVAK